MFPITVVESFSETPQNDQTDSNNPSAFADELFECVSPFCWVGTYRVNLYTLLYLTCCFHSPLNKHCNFLQYAFLYKHKAYKNVEAEINFESKDIKSICPYPKISLKIHINITTGVFTQIQFQNSVNTIFQIRKLQ